MGNSFSRNKNGRRKFARNQTDLSLKKRPCFDALSNDLILHIFTYINNLELINSVGRVSKRWRAISRDGALWKHVRLINLDWNADLTEIADLVERHAKSLYILSEHIPKTEFIVSNLIGRCSRLQYLTVRASDTQCGIIKLNHNLRLLAFERTNTWLSGVPERGLSISLEKVAADLFSQLAMIKHHQFNDISLIYQRLRRCENIENRIDCFIEELGRLGRNLRGLQLCLRYSGHKLRSQETAEIIRPNRGGAKFLRDLVRRLPQLDTLKLDYDEFSFRSAEPIYEGNSFDGFIEAFLSPDRMSRKRHLILHGWPVQYIESIIHSVNALITPEVRGLCLLVDNPRIWLSQSTRANFSIPPPGKLLWRPVFRFAL